METPTRSEAELIAAWIERNPYHPDASNVRLREYGYSIWALIGDLPQVEGDVGALADAFDIPIEAAEAALAYYLCHKAEIDGRLARNASYTKA